MEQVENKLSRIEIEVKELDESDKGNILRIYEWNIQEL
jgi:hypothetical protein